MRITFLAILLATPAFSDDWPQWMGPNRDGVWAETGLLDKFPEGGLKAKWSVKVGAGYSGPAVAKGRVYVMDYLKKEGNDKPDPGKRNELRGTERVLCLDSVTGTEKWVYEYDCPYHVSYPAGPRCTPTVDDGKVYTLGTMGKLVCLDAEKGTKIWSHDFPEKFKAKVPIWGFAGHPLVHGKLLICLAGGPEAMVVAFDKTTGDVVWQALKTHDDEGPGYCPPSIIEAGGVPQLIVFHPSGVVSLNPASGKTLWSEVIKPNYGMSIMMPRKSGDHLYAAGFGAAMMLKLDAKAPKADIAWRGKKDNAVYPANVTPIIADGVIYGVDVSGHLRAVKLATGERLWETTEPTVEADDKPTPHGTAFLVKNGDRWFLFNEKGSLIIAKMNEKKYEQISKVSLLPPTTAAFNRTVVWSHPAFAEKCVFVRNDQHLMCFPLAK